jgi:transcriptional regulator with XRE-family HTH domain
MNRNRRPSSEAIRLLGSNLKRLREALGYSQIELGRRSGVNVKRKRNTDILWRIGMNVRRLRKARGYTQVQLARRSGVSKAYVSKVEQEVLNSGIVHLEALAIGLECSLEDLTMRPPQQPEPVPCPGSS